MRKSWIQIMALGGVAGPVVFTINTLLWGSMRPNYDHGSQFISELGASGTPYAEYMNFVGFVPSGLLLTLFGIAIYFQLPKLPVSRLGAVLITLFGAGIVLAGFYSCDPGCPTQGSHESMMHNQISATAFVSAIFGYLLTGISFIKRQKFRRLGVYTMATALVAATFLLMMINSLEGRLQTGMWQRLLLFALFQWMVLIGWQVYNTNKADIA